ncbi:hypothetical protein I317_05426 [Kwoniella heveanensis CBS 569]|nr:hypothetical protein I317_05426 [Kwoniella heveanensis CBS 569]
MASSISSLPSLSSASSKFSQTLRPRTRPIFIAFLSLLILIPLIHYTLDVRSHWQQLPEHHRWNMALENTPTWVQPYVGQVLKNPAGMMGPPSVVSELRNAPWAGGWNTPKLVSPEYRYVPTSRGIQMHLISPAFVMLHIFSTSSAGSRKRRHFIRELGLTGAIPEKFRHLVEIKFVMGLQRPQEGHEGSKEAEEQEKEIARENELFGDIVRLRELEGEENMNHGKSWEWLRYVGREGGRKAWWVLKCDDDTLPILPNLLPFLLSLDPSKPTYIGSALGRWTGYHYYFQGMMYGFSWGVVKTMAVADVPRSSRNYQWDEDARMGGLMFSLPPAPGIDPNSTTCNPPKIDHPKWSLPPPSPDACTGLNWVDVGPRLGNVGGWGIADARRALAWHPLKNENEYAAAYERAKEEFERAGREYVWEVPDMFRTVAE